MRDLPHRYRNMRRCEERRSWSVTRPMMPMTTTPAITSGVFT